MRCFYPSSLSAQENSSNFKGNLFPLGTVIMLPIALNDIPETGPANTSAMLGLESDPQIKFLFGSKQVDPGWARLVEAAQKFNFSQHRRVLTNDLTVESMPVGPPQDCLGSRRTSAPEVVFISSSPHIMYQQARRESRPRPKFTRRDLKAVQEIADGMERDVLGKMGKRAIVPQQHGDGSGDLQVTWLAPRHQFLRF
ncbi:hypothetical protein EDD22DRAFT_1018454 [Suillus occidentalis]|nr:hypothetical protein EDD22DRAFT_1018454 [Suillus occidentalis]